MPIQVRPANIRTWIHDQNLGKLKRVLWEGQGDKLRMETSAHPAVRKFLAAVPYIMVSSTLKVIRLSQAMLTAPL